MAATLEQLAQGNVDPLPGFAEALGKLALWAMAKPERTFRVKEVVGRSQINRAFSVVLTEYKQPTRRAVIRLNAVVQPCDVATLLDLVIP
jgi:hypothetical protein